MTVTQDTEIDIFVASKIGSFKHVKYHTDSSKNSKKCIENLVNIKSLQKDDEITCMRWGNKEQTEILIGRKNQKIEIYSTQTATSTSLTSPDPGTIIGLGKLNDTLLSASSEGIVRLWCENKGLQCEGGENRAKDKGAEKKNKLGKDEVHNKKESKEGRKRTKLCLNPVSLKGIELGALKGWGVEGEGEDIVNTGGKLDVMVVCGDVPVFATGGEENDLKIYNTESKTPIFSAKNLAHDWLQLRRPVWVSGAAFAPSNDGKIVAVCSRHGYVRLYDTRAQRRPVVNVDFPNMAATCIVPSFDDRMYLVGFGRGQLHQVDLRSGKPDKGYKGCAGAITDIATAPGRLIVSTSLDRHLTVHKYDNKEMVYKQYLTSKLTRLLVQSLTTTPLRHAVEIKQEPDDDALDALDVADDMDVIFQKMETVGEKEKPAKKRAQPSSEVDSKRVKPSTEGSTSLTSDEAIAKLLRSTEKTKRKRDQKKKEKKAKSVFHNA